MNVFTIKDLETLSGIKAHTIRIWEQRYNFLKPQRSDTNIRYYSNEELKSFLNVALLNKQGVRISKIDKMTPEEIQQQVLSFPTEEAFENRQLNALINAMIDLDYRLFESTLNEVIRKQGLDKSIRNVIFPFLERIGILWMTSNITVAQEHLVSQLIRQKLVTGIDQLPLPDPGKPPVLIFLPEGEYHEIGVLYVQYLLKSSETPVINLGTDLPVADLASFIKAGNPGKIFTHITFLPSGKLGIENFLEDFKTLLPDRTLVISGHIPGEILEGLPKNIRFKRSLDAVLEELYS